MDYARDQGKAKPLAQQMGNSEFAIAAFTALLPGAVLVASGLLSFGWLAACIGAAALCTIWLARKFQTRLQGFTGDCLGAVQQLAEVAIYLVIVASLGRAAIA